MVWYICLYVVKSLFIVKIYYTCVLNTLTHVSVQVVYGVYSNSHVIAEEQKTSPPLTANTVSCRSSSLSEEPQSYLHLLTITH